MLFNLLVFSILFLVWFVLFNHLVFSILFLVGFVLFNLRFLRHGWETFSGVRVARSLDFYVMVGRLSVGFVRLNLYFSVSWLVDF